jgi:hypothetical protein
MGCSCFRAVGETGGGMGVRAVGFDQAWPKTQCHGGPVVVWLEGRGRPGRPVRCVRWPISSCFAGAEPGAHRGSARRLLREIRVLLCRALAPDGSLVEDRPAAGSSQGKAERCCGSGRRGVGTCPVGSTSKRASREGASGGKRANVPDLEVDKPVASPLGGRRNVASRATGPSLSRPTREMVPSGVPAGKRERGKAPEVGDAMNLGPYVVARPAGSEWRTRRPSRISITP